LTYLHVEYHSSTEVQTPFPQPKLSQLFLGIDIGGNHVKMGFVDPQGVLHDFQSYPTVDWRASGNFSQRIIETIAFKLINHKEVTRVGIGLPGTISKDRKTPLELPAIQELNGLPLWGMLHDALPHIQFFLENDANAAALGELYYGKSPHPEDFIFITLGTGIGSAAVMDRRLFLGGDGNAMELGHIVSRNGLRLEQNIGKQGLLNLAAKRLATYKGHTVIARDQPLSATRMVVAAEHGDEFSKQVFQEVGEMLGEGIVSVIRILDIKEIVIGGGLSASFDFVLPGIQTITNKFLSPYYLSSLVIRKASLGNDAGLLGAASLCF
jgi:glucokinase